MTDILWRNRGSDYQLGRFTLHTNVYVYVTVKRATKGWKWTVDANNGRHVASSGVYFTERETCENDVETWLAKYRREQS